MSSQQIGEERLCRRHVRMNAEDLAHVLDCLRDPARQFTEDDGKIEACRDVVGLKTQRFLEVACRVGRSTGVFHQRAAKVVVRDRMVGFEANHRLEVLDGLSQPVRLGGQETAQVEMGGDRFRIAFDRRAVGGSGFRRAIDADEESPKRFERLPRRGVEPHGQFRVPQRIGLPVGPIE